MIFQTYFPRIANFFGIDISEPEKPLQDCTIIVQCRLKKGNLYNMQAGSYCSLIIEVWNGKVFAKITQKHKEFDTILITLKDVKSLLESTDKSVILATLLPYLTYIKHEIK